jgi:hypothetical protein
MEKAAGAAAAAAKEAAALDSKTPFNLRIDFGYAPSPAGSHTAPISISWKPVGLISYLSVTRRYPPIRAALFSNLFLYYVQEASPLPAFLL